jgi:hypothetical protein
VDGFVVTSDPGFKGIVDLLNAFEFIAEKLFSYGSEEPFNLTSALWPVRWGVDQVNPVSGTNNFQVATGICGPIIRVK